MQSNQLISGQTYIDITDKKIPLLFTGRIEKHVNHGYNVYGDYVFFETVRTEENKNYNFPEGYCIFFEETNGNQRIIKN